MKHWVAALAFGLAFVVSGCTYYGYPAGTAPASYDRSFAAAADAMTDQGVAIQSQDRASGMILGQRSGTAVSANVRQQADGSVRVQFNANNDPRDPGLLERISQSYDRRMGR